MELEAAIVAKYAAVAPLLDESSRRRWGGGRVASDWLWRGRTGIVGDRFGSGDDFHPVYPLGVGPFPRMASSVLSVSVTMRRPSAKLSSRSCSTVAVSLFAWLRTDVIRGSP